MKGNKHKWSDWPVLTRWRALVSFAGRRSSYSSVVTSFVWTSTITQVTSINTIVTTDRLTIILIEEICAYRPRKIRRATHRARRSITFLQTARVDASETKARNYRALEAGSSNAGIAYRTSILAYYSNPSKYGYGRTKKRLRDANSLRCARHSRAFQFRTALS